MTCRESFIHWPHLAEGALGVGKDGFFPWQGLSIPALMRWKLTLKDFTSLTKRPDDLCEKAGRLLARFEDPA